MIARDFRWYSLGLRQFPDNRRPAQTARQWNEGQIDALRHRHHVVRETGQAFLLDCRIQGYVYIVVAGVSPDAGDRNAVESRRGNRQCLNQGAGAMGTGDGRADEAVRRVPN